MTCSFCGLTLNSSDSRVIGFTYPDRLQMCKDCTAKAQVIGHTEQGLIVSTTAEKWIPKRNYDQTICIGSCAKLTSTKDNTICNAIEQKQLDQLNNIIHEIKEMKNQISDIHDDLMGGRCPTPP